MIAVIIITTIISKQAGDDVQDDMKESLKTLVTLHDDVMNVLANLIDMDRTW